MTETAVSAWEAKRTDETRRIEDLLRKAGFERADAYRYNVAAIRVRVIDPRFEGLRVEQRDALVDPVLERLPEETQADITILLTFAPSELQLPANQFRGYLPNFEFDNPSPSAVFEPSERDQRGQGVDITLADGSRFLISFPAFVPMRHDGGDRYAPEPFGYPAGDPVAYPSGARSVPIYTDEHLAQEGRTTQESNDLAPLRVGDEATLRRVIANFERVGATHLAIDVCTVPGRPGGHLVPIDIAFQRTAVGEA